MVKAMDKQLVDDLKIKRILRVIREICDRYRNKVTKSVDLADQPPSDKPILAW